MSYLKTTKVVDHQLQPNIIFIIFHSKPTPRSLSFIETSSVKFLYTFYLLVNKYIINCENNVVLYNIKCFNKKKIVVIKNIQI